ncbi:ADP-ribosylation factor-like 16 [Strigomonas culicis]|uniref:ADP-ribosylation factor-like 16 n=1 Tax=Strigomonas culicis TaxID=28005 RepID=S9WMQ3_9TRYP|nr:ADP-ribosylation factor-like 16 [Strigomonas culicis]|eukprot:EPY37235.1 ADP-ribosylation factor-like 16 [Strigomonas culicis]
MLTLTLGPACSVEVREVGGLMVNSWEKFIKSKVSGTDGKAARYALLFVVSASAPQQLPLSISAFQLLKGCDGVCAEWPALIVVQKAGMPHVMSLPEVKQLVIDGALVQDTSIMEVDSWNGIGLGDVHVWLQKTFVL